MILTAHDDYSIYSQHNNIKVKSVDLIAMRLFSPQRRQSDLQEGDGSMSLIALATAISSLLLQ